jgi:hypothetical protein
MKRKLVFSFSLIDNYFYFLLNKSLSYFFLSTVSLLNEKLIDIFGREMGGEYCAKRYKLLKLCINYTFFFLNEKINKINFFILLYNLSLSQSPHFFSLTFEWMSEKKILNSAKKIAHR